MRCPSCTLPKPGKSGPEYLPDADLAGLLIVALDKTETMRHMIIMVTELSGVKHYVSLTLGETTCQILATKVLQVPRFCFQMYHWFRLAACVYLRIKVWKKGLMG